MYSNTWTVDVTRVLTRKELATVLADAKAKAERSLNAQRNLVIVRLACCCGLRVSEIGALQLNDITVDGARPHIRLRRETTKGKKARVVPLWWDAGTLLDLAEWKAERLRHGGRVGDPFVCSVLANRRGQRLQRAAIRRRFLSACKALGRWGSCLSKRPFHLKWAYPRFLAETCSAADSVWSRA